MGGGARAADPSPWQRFFAGLGPWDTASELTRFCFGALFFATVAPFVFSSALLSTLWEAVDRGFSGGVFLSGQEQTGFLLGRVVPWVNRLTHPINKRFVKNPVDSYMVNAVLLFGAVIPGLFLLCGLHTLRNGGHMSWLLCLAYHQFRLGPFVMNFGWVYALSHREGHAIAAKTGMWRPPFDKTGPLRYVFNYWIGLFFGVTPASFDVGHSIIHHKYSNDENDTITNADMPRDNWVSYVSYAPRWLLYSLNVTTFTHFVAQGNWKYARLTAFGSAWYIGFVWLVARCFGRTFVTAYVIYPLMEQVMLLMMANWSWHAFIDPTDATNENVLSTTILNGQINVLNEDAHVTHHKYPGTHWSNTATLLNKHKDDFDQAGSAGTDHPDGYGSVFTNTHVFEVGGLCVAGEYAELAKRFVGFVPPEREQTLLGVSAKQRPEVPQIPLCPLPQAEIEELLKARLRHCWFGPRAKGYAGAQGASLWVPGYWPKRKQA